MNRVVHFEIHAADMDKVQKFYESVFGWTFMDMGDKFSGYRVIMTGPGPDEMAKGVKMEDIGINGGLTKRPGPLPKADEKSVNAFVNIVGVKDADATWKKAIDAGATEAMPLGDVPGVGRLGYLKDPEGNIFGIITPTMPPGPPAA